MLYSVTDTHAKELSHMPFTAVERKGTFAQSLRTDKKMFQSNDRQMRWICELGGTIINEILIILLLKACFSSLVIYTMNWQIEEF